MSVLNEKVLPCVQTSEGQAYKRNTFNLHEAFLNCKSDSSVSPLSQTYNPSLTAGYRAIFNQLFNENKSIIHSFEMVSIDKIVILFNAPGYTDSTKPFWKRFDAIIDLGNPDVLSSTPIYKRCCRWFKDFYIQWQCLVNDLPTIRVEFNPNKADMEKLIALFGTLKSHALQFARVSRMDVCIDFAMYLNPLSWLGKGFVQTRDFKYNNVPQTRYFGSQQSDLQIRVYDKAFELKSQQEINIDFDFWRIEAQVQGIKGSSFFLLDVDTVKNFNPFSKLEFYDQYSFEVQEQGGYKAFIHCARVYGVDVAASLFNKNTKKKYLEQLKKDSEPFPFHCPSELYYTVFPSVYSMFCNKISNYFEKGQELQYSHYRLTSKNKENV